MGEWEERWRPRFLLPLEGLGYGPCVPTRCEGTSRSSRTYCPPIGPGGKWKHRTLWPEINSQDSDRRALIKGLNPGATGPAVRQFRSLSWGMTSFLQPQPCPGWEVWQPEPVHHSATQIHQRAKRCLTNRAGLLHHFVFLHCMPTSAETAQVFSTLCFVKEYLITLLCFNAVSDVVESVPRPPLICFHEARILDLRVGQWSTLSSSGTSSSHRPNPAQCQQSQWSLGLELLLESENNFKEVFRSNFLICTILQRVFLTIFLWSNLYKKHIMSVLLTSGHCLLCSGLCSCLIFWKNY